MQKFRDALAASLHLPLLRRFGPGGAWLLGGYGVQVVTGVVISVALANFLPREAFGTYQFILSAAAIVSVFTLTGMGTAIIRASAQGRGGVLRSGVRRLLLWSLGVTAASFILSAYYFFQHNSQLGIAMLVVGFVQPFVIAFAQYKWYLQGTERFRESVIIESTQRLLPFGVLFVAVLRTHSPVILVGVYLAAQALSLIASYIYVVRKYRLPIQHDEDFASYSKHLSVMESLAEVANGADKALVWVFLGAGPLAVYSLAQLPVVHLQTIFGFMRMLMFPALVRTPFAELRKRLPKFIRLYTVIAVVTVGLYIACAPFLFHLLFPAYHDAVIYSQCLVLMVLFVPRSLITHTFAAHQRTRELYIINVSTPLVRIALLAGLGYAYGLWGVVAAVLLTELFAAVLQWRLFVRLA